MKSVKLTKIFSEDVVSYALYKCYVSKDSRVFFKISHNIDIKTGRNWYYCCVPDVDLIEIRKDNTIIAYELKGKRKGKKPENKSSKGLAFYDGIGQALAYLNLPYISILGTFNKFNGGAFDFVYLVYARDELEFPDYEKRIFDLLPMGVILALPNGEFKKVREAPKNSLQSKEAKEHFLKNLDALEKFSVDGKIFRKIKERGEKYFLNSNL